MKIIRLAALALLALPGAPAAAQSPDIVIRGEIARNEIERILQSDNVDTTRLSPGQVADLIAGIERGRAPDDFWAAYLAHVRAWRQLAAAVGEAGSKDGPDLPDPEAAARAAAAIEATFDEVERIARRYGARMPTPPWNVVPTV